MKASALLFTSFVLASIFIYSCSPSNDSDVIIEGRVIDSELSTPILNSLVQVTSPQEFNSIFSRADSTGTYSLSIPNITAITDITLLASAPDYSEESRSLKVAEKDKVSNFDFELVSELDGETPNPSGPSNGAASIELVSISNETINIAATGGITSSTFTFVVKDSSGNSIDLNNKIDVEFSITSGPGGGEVITPTNAETNASGQIAATLQSGNIAGVVKIEAKIERTVPKSVQPKIIDETIDISRTDLSGHERNTQSTPIQIQASNQSNSKSMPDIIITSSPVAITIHGGFPDLNYFSLTPNSYNFEGFSTNDLRNPLKVILGDEFSNPVKPGTAVYFETTGGVIQGSGSGNTDNDGAVTVDLISSDPRPSDAITGSGGRDGYATITATTVDKTNAEIQKSINILFSTSKATITSAFSDFTLLPTETQDITYSVTDKNGNPMAPGTTIEVATDGVLTLSGATSITMGDELFPGADITDYTFSAMAPDEFSGSETITITTTSALGTVTTKSIQVKGTSGGVTGPSAGAATMKLVSITESTINIAESGGIANTSFTFQVLDSAGRSLDANSSIEVSFSILSGPGGDESITPTTATTDAQGRVTSNLNSGNAAGVVQIQAQISRPEVPLTITSKPVAVTIHGGFPVASNFNVKGENKNYEYLSNLEIPVTATLGDTHNNPVKPGTAVYFTTDNGLIDGSADQNTDADGKASVSYRPETQGSALVTATTVDENDTEITTTFDLLLTTPQALISSDFDNTEIVLAADQSQTVTYTVTDLNANPMAPGTSVEITTDNPNLSLSGNITEVIEDALTGGAGITSFSFNVTAGVDFTNSANVDFTVTSPSGVVSTHAVVITNNGGVVAGDPESPASMSLVSLTNETINIAETGGITSTTFTFQVQDSAGRALDTQSAVDVAFSILSGPSGGESISPTTATTDAQGRVTSNLNAGNTSGVVQIQAQVVGTSIISKPVAVTIHGGFPDQNHFTLEPLTNTNIEGFDRNGVEITFKVRVGDEFSNPVVPGTAVYFSTTGGLIQGSSTQNTDNDGYAEVKLFAGEPRPVNGRGVVTATTIDKNKNEISQTKEFIFSTSKALITTELTTLQLAEFESQRINYTVTDENENPMAAGTRIQVITEDKMDLSGELEYILTDELNSGTDITEFSFVATAPEGFKGSEIITIKVISPAGIVTTNKELTISGTGGGVAGEPSGAATILLENLTENTINIIETGGTVNSAFTFQVQDSSGRALNLDNPVEVEFEIIQGPGGGEAIIPTSAFTNSTGRVTSSIVSGNTAGVVRIQAKVERPDIGLTILSKPVAITIHGGFPDLDHFSIAPSNDPKLCQESANSYNFEGFNINGLKDCIVVIVGDKFSNPVKPGTAVYFSTTGGIIEGSAVEHTDDLGRASVTLLSANPRPADGKFVVTARTINETNDFIDQSIDMLFSTSQAQISANPTTFDLPPNGGATFTYTVEDINGNPMAAGTTINVLAGGGMEVTGDANVTLGDYLVPGPGATEFTFSIRDIDSDINDPADLSIQFVVTTPSGRVTSLTPISGTRRKTIK